MKQVYTNHKRLPLIDFHHDYDLIEDSDNKLLNKSNTKTWNEEYRGKEAARLIDNGNEFIIVFDEKRRLKIDYAEAEQLFILLSQCKWDGIEIKESKTTMKWPSSL